MPLSRDFLLAQLQVQDQRYWPDVFVLVKTIQLLESSEKEQLFWLEYQYVILVIYSYLLLGEEQPQCVGCNAYITVRNFLLE